VKTREPALGASKRYSQPLTPDATLRLWQAAALAESEARLKAALASGGGGEQKLLTLESAAAVLTEIKAGSSEFTQLEQRVMSKECLNGYIEVRRDFSLCCRRGSCCCAHRTM
jgi:hypothetical protein